jgi:hypothetical protein
MFAVILLKTTPLCKRFIDLPFFLFWQRTPLLYAIAAISYANVANMSTH